MFHPYVFFRINLSNSAFQKSEKLRIFPSVFSAQHKKKTCPPTSQPVSLLLPYFLCLCTSHCNGNNIFCLVCLCLQICWYMNKPRSGMKLKKGIVHDKWRASLCPSDKVWVNVSNTVLYNHWHPLMILNMIISNQLKAEKTGFCESVCVNQECVIIHMCVCVYIHLLHNSSVGMWISGIRSALWWWRHENMKRI